MRASNRCFKLSFKLYSLIPATFVFMVFFAAITASAQELSQQVRVVNVCVPVRVFAGDQFVDNLTLRDFAVFEAGEPQVIEAVYLVKGARLERKETPTAFEPETSRSFYLFFSMYEYDPQIRRALEYLFEKVIQPGDNLFVITPRKEYHMKKGAESEVPLVRLVDGLTKKIRKDIIAGDAAYRSVLADLRRLAGAGGITGQMTDAAEMDEEEQMSLTGEGTIEEFAMKYRSDVDRLEQLRTIDEEKFLEFARSLKKTEGQKNVFYFYQREFVPIPNASWLSKYEQNFTVQALMADLAGMLNRRSSFDVGRLRKAFADSTINVHFLYLTKNPAEIPLSQIAERSDIISTFETLVAATGGSSFRSANLEYLMEKAATTSENYYLLYYSPKDKSQDGRFREIRVEIKTGRFRLFHKAGYIAD